MGTPSGQSVSSQTRLTVLLRRSLIFIPALLFSWPARGQVSGDKPTDTTVCALRRNPEAWDRRLVRLTGYATHGYEESSVVDPACGKDSDGSPLWMDYGGRIGSATMYFGGDHHRHRKSGITVEGISIPLIKDDGFQRLDRILQGRSNSTGIVAIATTVEGRFFWGRGYDSPAESFGHFGCCSLFVITKVDAVADRPLTAKEERKAAETFHLPPPLPPPP